MLLFVFFSFFRCILSIRCHQACPKQGSGCAGDKLNLTSPSDPHRPASNLRRCLMALQLELPSIPCMLSAFSFPNHIRIHLRFKHIFATHEY
ncbi:hypothetical protein GYMLUDRAFT_716928 [Collybiopsis luxurians FD-317 M1]|nr:hypothetical protein GYMLUDRAFT_716928 [Collybiopsis luxurians FD-317 M1]